MTERSPFEWYFSIAEVAGRLGICQKTIRRRLEAGDFGAGVVAVGGRVRIPWSGVQAFLQENAREREIEVDAIRARTPGELARKVKDD